MQAISVAISAWCELHLLQLRAHDLLSTAHLNRIEVSLELNLNKFYLFLFSNIICHCILFSILSAYPDWPLPSPRYSKDFRKALFSNASETQPVS